MVQGVRHLRGALPPSGVELDAHGKSTAVSSEDCICCRMCELRCPDLAITVLTSEEDAMAHEIRFVHGNEACVEGALYAGLSSFAGYPITPSTEIAERLAERLPARGDALQCHSFGRGDQFSSGDPAEHRCLPDPGSLQQLRP